MPHLPLAAPSSKTSSPLKAHVSGHARAKNNYPALDDWASKKGTPAGFLEDGWKIGAL